MFRKKLVNDNNKARRAKGKYDIKHTSQRKPNAANPFPKPPKTPKSPMSALTLNSWDVRGRLFIHSVDRSGGLTGPRTAQGFRQRGEISYGLILWFHDKFLQRA